MNKNTCKKNTLTRSTSMVNLLYLPLGLIFKYVLIMRVTRKSKYSVPVRYIKIVT